VNKEEFFRVEIEVNSGIEGSATAAYTDTDLSGGNKSFALGLLIGQAINAVSSKVTSGLKVEDIRQGISNGLVLGIGTDLIIKETDE
jgi:hypothetical protein